MTLEQLYCSIGSESDYLDVLRRFTGEALVKRFVIKFLQDPSFASLEKALEEGNAEEAFRAAHTLKGVCLNLGFVSLYGPSSALTESLRGLVISDEADGLFASVRLQYEKLIEAINKLDSDA